MRAKILGAAAALAIAASGAQAVVYSYDGNFIADPGSGLPTEIDFSVTVPDAFFDYDPQGSTQSLGYGRTGTGAERFERDFDFFDGSGVILSPIFAAADNAYFTLDIDVASRQALNSSFYFEFGNVEYRVASSRDTLIIDNVIIAEVPSGTFTTTGLPEAPSPVPLPASAGVLAMAVGLLFGMRRQG